ncbi:anhydro-N-acetylmuramic acid kinase [Nesterenkonia massiliensis]|uniref:Anhydro-N-acetylmuramic acid kinase n=1 Tax=Nesterenkonia massiliensis TaxID=1232429 RepID=A0ABT2HSV6_9MICC|nr:anhydro-N-acetylmuramic acid kinase [Nesterenkonia massiliensis]MCT1607780.1 anhydro-N-acetylmuramic acid kinase [Nesterenkonia massiliensis]
MIIAGLMAGTSADALDVALVEFSDAPADSPRENEEPELAMRLLASREVPFANDLGRDILRLLEPHEVALQLVSSVDARLGQACAEAVAGLCAETGISCDLVASHGQTVRHDVAGGKVTSTLQLGQPSWIAETTGVPVLSDVRSRDVAAGGQGAPLVSILDHLLLSGSQTPTAMLNLGGIANITVVAPGRETIAFDTGPANALIDLMARRITGDPHSIDRDGALASQGRVDGPFLEDLLTEPYYALPAPKSTGKELFHSAYLERHLQNHPELDQHDAIATLTALTARTVAQACRAYGVSEVVASGGGTRNRTLMTRLREELDSGASLSTTDEIFGLPEGAKEACLMALIGWLSWHGLPATLPSVTGAAHGTLAGRFTPGHRPLRLPTPLHLMPSRLRVIG